MKRKILIPTDSFPEEPSRDLEQELKEAQAKIKQLETVLNYGVEMQKMVPRFEYMVLEAKLEKANFEHAQMEARLNAALMTIESEKSRTRETVEAATMAMELPEQLRFMEPNADARYRELSDRWLEVLSENTNLKTVLRNLRETAERLRVPIDEELLEY